MNYKNIRLILLMGAVLQVSSCYKHDRLPPANSNAYMSLINTSTDLRAGVSYGGNATAVRALVETNGKPDTGYLFINYAYIYPQPNGYLPFKAGNWKVSFKDSTQTPVTVGEATTRSGAYYSAIFADSLHHYSALLVADDYRAVPDKALVRVMHFSPDGGEVALYRDTTAQEKFGVMRYKQVTSYIPMEPGSNFSFIVRRNDGSGQRVARYFVPDLAAGAAYTILLKGYVAPPDGDIANKNCQIIFYRN